MLSHHWIGPYDGGWHCYQCGVTVTLPSDQSPAMDGCPAIIDDVMERWAQRPNSHSAGSWMQLAAEFRHERDVAMLDLRQAKADLAVMAERARNREQALMESSKVIMSQQEACALASLAVARMKADLDNISGIARQLLPYMRRWHPDRKLVAELESLVTSGVDR